MQELLLRIEQLKGAIEQLRPLDKHTLGKIEQKFRLDWNYHSNAIEGNSLNFGETKSFLLHGITAAGKPLKDHLDLRGHNEAILALEDIIKEERPISEHFIRELHQVILVEDSYNPAQTPDDLPTRKKIKVGQYKSTNNHVQTSTGEIFYFASVEETPAKMNDLIEWLREHKEQENPVVVAALFHYKFIVIHPFDDGNGRLARILMNFILMRAGFPPVVIKTKEKEAYFRALRQADGGNTSAFVEYIAEQLLASLELYLTGARGESIEELEDVDKEFELFKMELEGKEEVVYLTEENYEEKLGGSLFPLLIEATKKLEKIDSMFQNFSCEMPSGVVLGSLKALIPRIMREVEEIYQTKGFALYCNWANFNRKIEGVSSIKYVILFEVVIEETFFTFNYYVDAQLKSSHHCIYQGNYETLGKQIATQTLQDFMEFIRERTE